MGRPSVGAELDVRLVFVKDMFPRLLLLALDFGNLFAKFAFPWFSYGPIVYHDLLFSLLSLYMSPGVVGL